MTEKRNHTWCDTIQGRVWEREVTAWLDLELDSGGSVSRCGVCPTIQDRVWPCERGTWLTGVWRWRRWPVGEGYGWLWSSRWRWIDFVTDVKLWIVNCELRERLRSKEKDGWSRSMDARVKKSNAIFFVFIVPLKPNRFGSVGVFPVSGFWNRNRTENFCKKFNRFNRFFFRFDFFGYFFLGFLGLFGFSVFLLTPTFYKYNSHSNWHIHKLI